MWKIAVGFIIFAALAMYVVIKGGDKLSMGGEQHGTEVHAPADAASAPASAPAPADAASAAASAASAPR